MLLWALILLLPSCRLVSSVIHDGDVVARYGKHRLFRSELESVIPPGTEPGDSANLAKRYIETWAADLIYEDAAGKSLSKKDLDISEQMEIYRRSLVKYRYEQKFVNERLDTLVSEMEINDYYEENKERYVLSFPIVKARMVKIGADSPRFDEIRQMLSDGPGEDGAQFTEMMTAHCDRYTDFAGKWIDITVLAEEFNVDYGTLLALMNNSAVRYSNADGTLTYAYIVDYMRSGMIPPVEYCESIIRDVIVNSRKQALINGLERDLLNDARSNGKFVIY